MPADFGHHGANTLPVLEDAGLRVIAGEGWGSPSPGPTHWPLFHADAKRDCPTFKGSCRLRKEQIRPGGRFESAPRPGEEPAVVNRAPDLAQEICAASRPSHLGLPQSWGCKRQEDILAPFIGREAARVVWILRLVKIGTEAEGQAVDVMEINRPYDLGNIADLGLTLAETKRLLARLQQEIVAAQVREHAARRPTCSRCGDACRVKDYREHVVATLFGQVTVRLPRFRCAACGGIEAGVGWPSYCRATPELVRLQAHLCALTTYRTAADLLEQMFPVNAAKHPETVRRHALKVGEVLQVPRARRKRWRLRSS
jgi:hypothetical protein